MAEETAGERTESATPRRREKARNKGQVAKSQEVNSFFVLIAGAIMLVTLIPYSLDLLGRNARYLFSQAHFLAPSDLMGVHYLLTGSLKAMALTLAPLAGVILVAGVGASILQVGIRLSPEAMGCKWSRLNPLTGAKRFFQKRTFFELWKNFLKVGMITLLAWAVIRHLWPELNTAALLPLAAILDLAEGSYIRLMAVLLAFLALLAIVD